MNKQYDQHTASNASTWILKLTEKQNGRDNKILLIDYDEIQFLRWS